MKNYQPDRCPNCNRFVRVKVEGSNRENYGLYCGKPCQDEDSWRHEPLKTQHNRFIYGRKV